MSVFCVNFSEALGMEKLYIGRFKAMLNLDELTISMFLLLAQRWTN